MANPGLSKDLAREAVAALVRAKGNASHAAAALGLHRATFQTRLQTAERRYGIKIPRPKATPRGEPVLLVPPRRITHGKTGVAETLDIPVPKHGLRIAVIPDCQIVPKCPTDHLVAAARYLAAKQPEVIVNIGDFADMPSLSRFGRGMLRFEGRRYQADIDAANRANELFVNTLAKAAPRYKPRKVITLGNHEAHIDRAADENPFLHGLIKTSDLRYAETGWEVFPFLQPVVIAGTAFSHYFPSGMMDRPVGTAAALITKLHMSTVAGHQQGLQIHTSRRADGALLTGVIAGSFYMHDMEYLSPLSNKHWRGMLMLHECKEGSFDHMPISLNYLLRRFG